MPEENLHIRISERGARTVERNIAAIGTSAGAAGTLVKQLKGILLTLGAGFALTAVIHTIASFGQEMSTVRAITGATQDQFAALRKETRHLGATTRFTATQAAEGASYLARAGFDTDQILKSLHSTLNLAQAGALGMGQAADIASNVLQGFRLHADEAQRVVDVLAKAANSSNTNVQQLGEALSYAAPSAASFKISVEETAAAVGAMSNAGIQASRAGTGLRQIMAALAAPTGNAAKVFKALHISMSDIDIKTRGFIPVLELLRKKGIDGATAFQIFGRRAAPAFQVLSDSLPNLKRLTELFKNSKGTAQEMADVMNQNLNGALLEAKSAAEALVLTFGDLGNESSLTKFFRGLAASLRGLASHLRETLNELKVVAVGVAVVFREQLAGAFLSAAGGLRALTLAMAANPFTAWAVAITAIVAYLVRFKDTLTLSGHTATTVGDLFAAAWSYMSEAVGAFMKFFNDHFGPLAMLVEDVVGSVDFSIEGMIKYIAIGIDGLIGLFKGGWAAVLQLTDQNLGRAFLDIIIRSLNKAIEYVNKAINTIIGFMNNLIGVNIAPVALSQLDNKFKGGASDLGKKVANAFKEGFKSSNAAEGIVDSLIAKADAIAAERRKANLLQPIDTTTLPKRREMPNVKLGAPLGNTELTKALGDLQRQSELLKMNARDREVYNNLLQMEDNMNQSLSNSERQLLVQRLKANQALQDQADLLDEIHGPQEKLKAQMTALNALYQRGAVSEKEFKDKMLEIRIAALDTDKSISGSLMKGLLKMKQQMNDIGGTIAKTMRDAFSQATDALVNFVMTGKLNFNDFVKSILADLARLAVQETIMKPLLNAVGSMFGMTGFATGGSFIVPGSGGTDSQMVGFMATPGEQVTVQTPAQQKGNGGGGATNVIVNFVNQSGHDLNTSEQRKSKNANGDPVIDIIIKSSLERLDGSGALDSMFNRHNASRQVQR